MEIVKLVDNKINFTCLHLFHYNVDAILVNRIYPKQAMEGYFNKWMIRQEESLYEIKESFSEVPKFYIELQKEELWMLPVLQKTGVEVFKNTEADDVLFSREIYRLEQEKGVPQVSGTFSGKWKGYCGAVFEDGYLSIKW